MDQDSVFEYPYCATVNGHQYIGTVHASSPHTATQMAWAQLVRHHRVIGRPRFRIGMGKLLR